MDQNMWGSFVVLTTALPLVMQLFMLNFVMAQVQNTTLTENQNNTRMIVNLKNNTLTLIDKTTNETISVKNLTTNQTISVTNFTGDRGNATTNETLTTIPENATINDNLTAKFKELQGN